MPEKNTRYFLKDKETKAFLAPSISAVQYIIGLPNAKLIRSLPHKWISPEMPVICSSE